MQVRDRRPLEDRSVMEGHILGRPVDLSYGGVDWVQISVLHLGQHIHDTYKDIILTIEFSFILYFICLAFLYLVLSDSH